MSAKVIPFPMESRLQWIWTRWCSIWRDCFPNTPVQPFSESERERALRLCGSMGPSLLAALLSWTMRSWLRLSLENTRFPRTPRMFFVSEAFLPVMLKECGLNLTFQDPLAPALNYLEVEGLRKLPIRMVWRASCHVSGLTRTLPTPFQEELCVEALAIGKYFGDEPMQVVEGIARCAQKNDLKSERREDPLRLYIKECTPKSEATEDDAPF